MNADSHAATSLHLHRMPSLHQQTSHLRQNHITHPAMPTLPATADRQTAATHTTTATRLQPRTRPAPSPTAHSLHTRPALHAMRQTHHHQERRPARTRRQRPRAIPGTRTHPVQRSNQHAQSRQTHTRLHHQVGQRDGTPTNTLTVTNTDSDRHTGWAGRHDM
jgi:hypothetical protein